MELKKLISYKKDIAAMRLITFTAIILSFLFSGFVYWTNMDFLEKEKSKKIVLDQENNAYLATNTEVGIRGERRKAQYTDHVNDFYRLFYQFDQGNIDQNLDRALLLIGQSGEELYKEYLEMGIINKVKENNWRSEVTVMDVQIDMTTTPVSGVAYARQKLIRPGGSSQRNLYAKFKIYDVGVTYDNPHGALIENFELFDKSIIKDTNE